MQASVICRPSIKPIFSQPVKQINAKFGGEVPFYLAGRPVSCKPSCLTLLMVTWLATSIRNGKKLQASQVYRLLFTISPDYFLALAEIMVRCGLSPASGIRPSVGPSIRPSAIRPSSRLSLRLLRLFGSDFTCELL